MKTRTVTEPEGLALAAKPEGHFFDRKSASVSGKKLQKTLVAFANADGGEALVGVADDDDEPILEKRWNGFKNLEDANGLLQSAFNLQPTLDLRYEILESASPGYVLRIIVEKSSQLCKTSDGTVYVRHGAQSLPVEHPDKILELSFAKGTTSFEDQILTNVQAEAVVESPKVADFLADYSPKTDPLD